MVRAPSEHASPTVARASSSAGPSGAGLGLTKALLCSLVLGAVALGAGCTCPQSSGARAAHAGSGQGDPAGGTFAFFGSLKGFFVESPPAPSSARACNDADLSDKPKTEPTDAQTPAPAQQANLSIR